MSEVFIIGILTGFIATVLGQIFWKKAIEKLLISPDTIDIHGKVKAYGTREKVAEVLGKIIGNTRTGDVLFGHCRTCGRYPKEFFDELEEAKKRGVGVMAIITLTDESLEFAQKLLEIGKDAREYGSEWEVKGFESEEIKIRVFGYKSRDRKRGEILIAFPFIDAYIGLYFKDRRVVEYLWPSFEEKWISQRIKSLKLKNGAIIYD